MKKLSKKEIYLLMCRYYALFKLELANLAKEVRNKKQFTIKLKNRLSYANYSNELLKVYDIFKKILIANPSIFGKYKTSREIEKNITYYLYALSQDMIGKNKKWWFNKIENIIQSRYKCNKYLYIKYSFLDFLSKLDSKYLKIVFILLSGVFLWYFLRFVNTSSIAYNHTYIVDYKTGLSDYFKQALTTEEFNFLRANDKVFNKAIFLNFKNLSWDYIKYQAYLYSLNYLFKIRVGLLCNYFNNVKYCYFDMDQVNINRKFWLDTIQKYKSNNNKNIRIAIIYIKLMLFYEKK